MPSARLAGAFYVISVVSAVSGEFLFPHRLGIVAIVVPVSCYFAVTVLLYRILAPVNGTFAALATLFQFATLVLEALELRFARVNLAIVLHGFFCLLIGYLFLKSRFVPRILSLLMAGAGVVWITFLSPSLFHFLSPYNTALGLAGEGMPMLWLLFVGIAENPELGETPDNVTARAKPRL